MAQNFEDLFKKVQDGTMTVRILPSKINDPTIFTHTRVHKINCPICDFESGDRRKKRYRSIDEPFEPS